MSNTNRMIKIAVMCLVCMLYASCTCIAGDYIKEIKVRTREITNTYTGRQMIDNVVSRGIPAITITFKDDVTGELFYPSSIPGTRAFTNTMPSFNMSMLFDLVQYAHSRGLTVNAWIPCFLDPVYISYNPSAASVSKTDGGSLVSSTTFTSPFNNDVKNHLKSIISEINNVDGFRLDYIRFSDDSFSFDNAARSTYQALYGDDPVNIAYNTDAWDDWCNLRANQITDFLHDVRDNVLNATIELGIQVLPFSAIPEGYLWFTDSGNDYSKYDFLTVCILTYYEDWSTRDEWRTWTHDRLHYAKSLSNSPSVLATFSISELFVGWGNQAPVTEQEVSEILGGALVISKRESAQGVALYNHPEWTVTEWNRLDAAITYACTFDNGNGPSSAYSMYHVYCCHLTGISYSVSMLFIAVLMLLF